jgi:hypothetical protein
MEDSIQLHVTLNRAQKILQKLKKGMGETPAPKNRYSSYSSVSDSSDGVVKFNLNQLKFLPKTELESFGTNKLTEINNDIQIKLNVVEDYYLLKEQIFDTNCKTKINGLLTQISRNSKLLEIYKKLLSSVTLCEDMAIKPDSIPMIIENSKLIKTEEYNPSYCVVIKEKEEFDTIISELKCQIDELETMRDKINNDTNVRITLHKTSVTLIGIRC